MPKFILCAIVLLGFPALIIAVDILLKMAQGECGRCWIDGIIADFFKLMGW